MSDSRQPDGETSGLDYRSFTTPSATQVGAPLVVDNPDAFAWDDTCDMLVIGGGLAGVTTALRGAELGLDVVLADRFRGGGTSALSGGVIYAGGGTHVQRECGIEDSPQALADYLQREVGELLSRETVQRYARRSAGMIDWLEQQGVQFTGPVASKKTSYPPPSEFLYYSGNETVPAFAGVHPPAPRGHRARSRDPRDNNKFSGEIMMATLLATLKKQPIRFRQQAAARRLITDTRGRVIGAELWRIPPESRAARLHAMLYDISKRVMLSITGIAAPMWMLLAMLERRHARPLRVRARRGVVLCSGGFIHNPPMVRQAAPVYARADRGGSPGDDGSAVRLVQGLGAKLGQMHLLSAWRFVNPPYSWMKGIIVSGDGRRIVNEEQYGARLGDAIFQHANGKAWLIVDSIVQEAAKRELNDDELWPLQRVPTKMAVALAKSAPTIAALEAKLKMPAASIAASVRAYNEAMATGAADPQGKSAACCQALAQGPFYAMDLSAGNSLNPLGAITLGGVDVDEQSGAVRTNSGAVIDGLYAAGRAAVGLCSASYVSGLALGDCLFSGLRAAESIAGVAVSDA